jgi:hypothetical protein
MIIIINKAFIRVTMVIVSSFFKMVRKNKRMKLVPIKIRYVVNRLKIAKAKNSSNKYFENKRKFMFSLKKP